MATISNPYDPNDPNKQPNTGGGGDVIQTGSSAGGGGASGGGSGTPTAQQPYSPPNVQQYLNANQGAGEQLSGAIQGNVQNQANKVNQSVQQTQSELDKQYQPLQQDLSQGQSVANQAFKDPSKLLDAYNQAKTQSSSQPLQNANSSDALNQYNQFQQAATGGYNPAIQSYGNAANQAYSPLEQQSAGIQQQANAATNEMGRNQLLQQTVAQPNYSQGQQTLDSLFLQGQGNQLKKGLGGIAGQVGQNVSGANADAQAKLQALQGMSGQNQNYIKDLFTNGNPNQQGSGLNQISGNVKNEYNNLATTSAQQQKDIASAVKSGKVSPEQAKQLGLTAGMHTWGADINPYLSNNAVLAADQGGYAQAASPEEFARYNALNQLAGGGQNPLQASMFGSSSTAGGYSPVKYDTAALNKAIAEKQKTITGVDFQNALQGSLGQFQVGNQQGGVGGGYSSNNSGNVGDYLAPTLSNQLANGQLNPEQARQMIDQWANTMGSAYGDPSSKYENYFKNFNDYYSNEYAPAAGATIGPAPISKNVKGN